MTLAKVQPSGLRRAGKAKKCVVYISQLYVAPVQFLTERTSDNGVGCCDGGPPGYARTPSSIHRRAGRSFPHFFLGCDSRRALRVPHCSPASLTGAAPRPPPSSPPRAPPLLPRRLRHPSCLPRRRVHAGGAHQERHCHHQAAATTSSREPVAPRHYHRSETCSLQFN